MDVHLHILSRYTALECLRLTCQDACVPWHCPYWALPQYSSPVHGRSLFAVIHGFYYVRSSGEKRVGSMEKLIHTIIARDGSDFTNYCLGWQWLYQLLYGMVVNVSIIVCEDSNIRNHYIGWQLLYQLPYEMVVTVSIIVLDGNDCINHCIGNQWCYQ